MAAQASGLKVIEFGPKRGIGVSMLASSGADFSGLWQNQIVPRNKEVAQPPGAVCFGVCRCVPGATDGTFEYVALLEATADAPVPPGMIAIDIPRGHYAVFEAAGFDRIGAVWHSVPAAMAAQTEWKPRCGPQGCDCAHWPSFEYYPPEPGHQAKALIYVPVSRA